MIQKELKELLILVERLVFPETYGEDPSGTESLEKLLEKLTDAPTAAAFMGRIGEIARILNTDVDAVLENDPACTDRHEVILCYPAIKVMLPFRVAHELLMLGVPLIPRMLTEMAHSATGIDIHPAATIGEHFAIDHGTGIVIGETTVIGNNVMLYQGVTLGAKNFHYDSDGRPLNEPRHPILEDNVTVYSNTSILGRVRIGHDTVIGGNVWLTRDVPPYSRILQSRAILQPLFSDGEGI
jgi:serine O-acetyltransferase